MSRRLLVAAFLVCALSLGLPVAAATAATVGAVEAETMSSARRYGTRVLASDAASGGKYLEVNSNVSVRKSVRLTAAASSLLVRARTDDGAAPARMVVTVDSDAFPETSVAAPAFGDFVYAGDWAPGRHTVTVRFRNAEARNLYLDVLTFGAGEEGNRIPTAAFTVTTAGLAASFDGTGSSDPDGALASHVWEYGDGSSGSGATAAHAYAAAGAYTATLTVTDNRGPPPRRRGW